MTSSRDIRRAFLDFFRARGHEEVASSPLVPANDPTLLFTNAGMVQFKEAFLGLEKRPYVRAASSQRCVRAGGKHNDLENVGYTARHHTFFEMLGNFSFGDYFKPDAIGFAWEFLTDVMGLPEDRLWVTVYKDDEDAARIWLDEVGVDPVRFSRIGDKAGGKRYESDNFWSMGDTGPCGPCTEIFYDHGADIPGGPPGTPEEDGDRYIEIWNLVFMQYDRAADGAMTELPHPSVDTGMGLERLAAVMQGVHNNYEIDLFQELIAAVVELGEGVETGDKSCQVIADHIRSSAFLVVDGVVPSNEGRGYVLRRIIRRAIRHGHRLGLGGTFFHRLVKALVHAMGDAYPELVQRQEMVEKVLRQEEERFAETLDQGMKILEQAVADLKGDTLPGETVFRLYDTFGFPVDLTADIARERGFKLDEVGFERAMQVQRERARAASQFGTEISSELSIDHRSDFLGYEGIDGEGVVVALYRGDEEVNALAAGDDGVVVLDRTPFYAESGGQVGDRGELLADATLFQVRDTQKRGKAHAHVGGLKTGSLRIGDRLGARVDGRARLGTARNHSATHLMHAALREVLGEHVAQKGSLVAPDRLRFDFSHFQPVSDEELSRIETRVNEEILANAEVDTQLMDLQQAMDSGAMALFGEKYEEKVRVLSIGEYSTELCGGTHVRRAGDIGLFKIVSETGIASGVRRIEALTGAGALAWTNAMQAQIGRLAELLKADREQLEDKVVHLLARGRELEKELDTLTAKLSSQQGDELVNAAVDVDGIKVVGARLEGADAKSLRDTVDQLKNKLGTAAVVLAVVNGDKVALVAGVTKDATPRIQAGALVNHVASQVGGRGGGRPDMAQAGGSDAAALPAALAGVPDWVRENLA